MSHPQKIVLKINYMFRSNGCMQCTQLWSRDQLVRPCIRCYRRLPISDFESDNKHCRPCTIKYRSKAKKSKPVPNVMHQHVEDTAARDPGPQENQSQPCDVRMYEPEELTASKKKELKGKCLVAGCGEPSEKPFDQRYKLCEKHKVVCLPLLPGSTLQLEKYIRL